jgi:hypothetical protein
LVFRQNAVYRAVHGVSASGLLAGPLRRGFSPVHREMLHKFL